MVQGLKTVELRRRNIPVKNGDRVWIYSTLPSGTLTAMGIVSTTYHSSPTDIWRRFGLQTGVSLDDFNAYFAGIQMGCAIVFQKVIALDPALDLADLRSYLGAFSPPQFFRALPPHGAELNLFRGLFRNKQLAL